MNMGGSCSSQRRRRHRRADDDERRRSGEGGGRGGGGRFRSRSFSSAVGRLCGGSQDGSSSDESNYSMKNTSKRAARHSVDAEVPDQSISHLYPSDDNYEPHPTDPTRRCPKSLTDLCIDTICRSLPNLEGELPSGLPQDVVDRIVQSLTSHAALNSTTLRTLSRCELGALSLANCRGVSDEWLVPLGSGSVSSGSPARKFSGDGQGLSPPPMRDVHPADFMIPSNLSSSFLDAGSSSSMMMDLDEYDNPYPEGDNSLEDLRPLPLQPRVQHHDDRSCESRSTSSFVSASSRPPSPLLPSVLPPPEFFSLKYSSPAQASSSLWLHPARGSSLADANNNLLTSPLSPMKLYTGNTNDTGPNVPYAENNSFHDESNFAAASPYHAAPSEISPASSTLALLDLRGSQRLTDRGLLQLSKAPLRSLEVVRLDNCHGITGRGLLAFSRSTRLHTLSLANCRRLTDEAVVNVGDLGPSLAALDLGGCRCLTDRSLEAVGGLVGLRKLDLSQCDLITDDGLANLDDLVLIDELNLGWCRLISDDGLKILAGQPNRSRVLTTLRLARCSITDEGLEHLEKLEYLEELDLNGCVQISSSALGDTLGRLIRLTSLDVSYCPGILRSSWQGKVNSLKSLELCYSGVRDSHLSRLRSLPTLEELNLDSCIVADWGIAHLVDNRVTPNLTTLDLADTDISDAAMSKIARLENMQHLSLFYCNITNRGLRYLASMKNLKTLNLDSREIGDDGLKYLRGLPLTSLDLFSSRVTDLGCAYLSKIKTLTSLELCGGGIGDTGCAHLATISNLTSLNLSQNENITNRGAASLAALTNLKALNLSNTCVSSDALKFFGGLLKLQSLALYGCQDMEDDPRLSSLQRELPSLRCLRLNSPSDEDGVIDCGSESQDEEEDSDFNDDDDEENDDEDEDQMNHGFYHRLSNEGEDSVGSSEGFQDAYHEVQSDAEDESDHEDGNMDFEI